MANHDAINDVRRKINEVLKKDEQRIVVGWRPTSEPTRKEGDVWEDSNGRQWTIKNGIRQNVTKLDAAKTPWWCPNCRKPLNHRFDIKFWKLRNKCMDCVIHEETEMRRLGTYAAYEKNIMRQNYIASLKDRIAELQHYHDTVSAPEFINADDANVLMIEKWNVDIPQIKKDLVEEINKLKDLLNEAEKIMEEEQNEISN